MQISDNKERTLTFGKYKGQEIKYIILTDIGYIVWCFENIRRFKLTDEEQAILSTKVMKILDTMKSSLEAGMEYLQDDTDKNKKYI